MYGGSGLPLAQFGGYLSVSGGGGDMYPSYLTRYNIINNLNSPLSMALSSDIIGNQINMEVTIEVTGEIEYTNNKVVFILSSYQDEDYFCSVISYDYLTFDLNNIGQSQTYQSSTTIDPSWDINQIKFSALVQSFSDENILQASSVDVPLNNLLVMDTQISAIYDQNGGDGDGAANPGEDIEFSLDIINESLELGTISQEVIVSTSTDGINILNSEFSLQDDIGSDEILSVLVPISIDESINLGDVIFNITLICDYVDNYSNELTFSKTYERSIQVDLYQQGFPYIISSQVFSSPAVTDIDGDGINDIIFGDYLGRLHVIDEFGSVKPGFPFDLGDQIWGSSAVNDIDNDGDIEIVVCSKNTRVYALNSDGTQQFQYNTGKVLFGTPALGNIDDDDDLEIIIGSFSSPASSNRIYVINPDGSDVNGFPYNIGEKMLRGVALADFNNNGKVDIVVGTDSENIYLIYDDGTVADGFPFEGDSDFRSAPTILNYSGQNIILAGSKDGTFYGIDQYGALIFAIETSNDIMASPSILSIGDGPPIIFFGNDDGEIYAILPDGSILDGWPITLSEDIISSIVFSDLNSDLIPEIIFPLDNGSLYVLDINGNDYDNAPFQYAFPYTSSPTIIDLDFDGDLEIFCGSGDGLNVFDIKEEGINEGYWNIFRGNLNRDGYYHHIVMGDVNYDSNSDIFDIILIVSFILDNIDTIDFEYADINSDGFVDISDVILLLNYILLD